MYSDPESRRERDRRARKYESKLSQHPKFISLFISAAFRAIKTPEQPSPPWSSVLLCETITTTQAEQGLQHKAAEENEEHCVNLSSQRRLNEAFQGNKELPEKKWRHKVKHPLLHGDFRTN